MSPEAGNELATLLRPFWTSMRAQAALGLPSKLELEDLRKDGSILALTAADGETLYPVFQFQRHGHAVEVNPALLPVFRTLRGFDPWTIGVLLHTPAPELHDRTPLEWIADGQSSEDLAGLIDAVAREWAAGDP